MSLPIAAHSLDGSPTSSNGSAGGSGPVIAWQCPDKTNFFASYYYEVTKGETSLPWDFETAYKYWCTIDQYEIQQVDGTLFPGGPDFDYAMTIAFAAGAWKFLQQQGFPSFYPDTAATLFALVPNATMPTNPPYTPLPTTYPVGPTSAPYTPLPTTYPVAPTSAPYTPLPTTYPTSPTSAPYTPLPTTYPVAPTSTPYTPSPTSPASPTSPTSPASPTSPVSKGNDNITNTNTKLLATAILVLAIVIVLFAPVAMSPTADSKAMGTAFIQMTLLLIASLVIVWVML